jgi:hypothetical protein
VRGFVGAFSGNELRVERTFVTVPAPFGVCSTQWKLLPGCSLVVTAPRLPLLVHEFNHRDLDNLQPIEGFR